MEFELNIPNGLVVLSLWNDPALKRLLLFSSSSFSSSYYSIRDDRQLHFRKVQFELGRIRLFFVVAIDPDICIELSHYNDLSGYLYSLVFCLAIILFVNVAK